MRPSLYEFAGAFPAFTALAAAHHQRCLDDPELNHPFSHPDGNPAHIARLAAYWAEVLGGPREYSSGYGNQSTVQAMHYGNGDMTDLGRRFVVCFVQAMDDAGLPEDVEFRAAMEAYMVWAVDDVLTYTPDREPVTIPHWSWDGLVGG